jgi:predicted component of type VI protein secretion system
MSVLRLIPTKGEAIVVDADEALVGRETNCNVVVPHPSVSRRHALLKRKQDVFFVVDQGSANGTFVDSKRVVDAPLREGSVLRFGSASFKVEIRDDLHVESIAEDDLVIAPTMVGQAQSFSATVHEGAPLVEDAGPDYEPPERDEAPPITLQSPAPRPARVADVRPEPARAQPVAMAPPAPSPAAPKPSPAAAAAAAPTRGPAFWLLIGAGALALLLVGAALGLAGAFFARRMGWL